MNSNEIRQKFLEFFKEKGHVIVPSSSMLPDDPSVLLTSAGMQQFKPYYTGQADPMVSPHHEFGGKPLGSKNAVSAQKCFRTSDIDEVGDETHLTFFEMLGNFSFGGYFKEEAIRLAHEFLTDPKWMGLTIDYVTIFGGDEEVPVDYESFRIWKEEIGIPIEKIKKCGRKDNFWGPTGNEGPCGPTTEIYINGTEIWNIVFNQYYCKADKTLVPLAQNGVDTGMGLERLAMVVQNAQTIFKTDLFVSLFALIPENMPMRTRRIVADHAHGVVFLLSDGVRPSNKEAGYILRRLMRRMLVYEHLSDNAYDSLELLKIAVANYGDFYGDLKVGIIEEEFRKEKEKFIKSIARGLRMLEKEKSINAKAAFKLYETFGLPFEIIKELGGERAQNLTREGFDEEFKRHQ